METPMRKPARAPTAYGTVLVVLVALAIVIWAASVLPRLGARSAPLYPVTIQERAWYACTAHIAEQYQFSFFEAQRYYAGGVATLSSDTYQARMAYSKQGRTMLCKIQLTPSGSWQLLELR